MAAPNSKPGENESGGEPAVAVRRTNRWRGVVSVALLALAIGLLAKRPLLLMLSAAAVAFAAYPQLTGPPNPVVQIEREVDPDSPRAGDLVDVKTTIRNVGDATLFDLRLVDGVPPMLSVEGGSPRRGTALRPGSAATIEYSIRARHGTHRFRPTMVIARDASGATETETTATEETVIECGSRVPEVPLRATSRHRSGQLVTDDGGSGLEFHRVKEYERGDSTSRIDWRRYARTGELISIDFRKEQLADIVLCVDAREAAYRASSEDNPHAVAYATDAADRIAGTLFQADHRVGLAAVGRTLCWLPPGTGRDHRERLSRLLAVDPALSLTPPRATGSMSITGRRFADFSAADTDGGDTFETMDLDRQLSTIRTHINDRTQVFFLTPLCDDEAVRIAQWFESSGCAVTVVSPDVTADETAGGRLVRTERLNRLKSLHRAGIPAVDWDTDERLGTALAGLREWFVK